MKYGLALGYWRSPPGAEISELISEAERLGFDSVWTAEAYGSDALTPLAWLGSQTSRMRLGTAVMQMPARAPTATAMAAMTMDHLSAGRFVLGLGLSGPQVAEGWYGQPFSRPLDRAREYIGIVRDAIARRDVVTSDGPHYPLPRPGGTGLGKPLKSILHPLRPDLPIFLGAEGPRNVALAAEIADGLLTGNFLHHHDHLIREALAEGFGRPGARRDMSTFEVVASVPLVMDEDVNRAADRLRPALALTIGGMGARANASNFHANVFVRAGWADDVARIQDLYAQRKFDEAAAAVPLGLAEEVALLGSTTKLRAEIARWKESAATMLLLPRPTLRKMRAFAELVGT